MKYNLFTKKVFTCLSLTCFLLTLCACEKGEHSTQPETSPLISEATSDVIQLPSVNAPYESQLSEISLDDLRALAAKCDNLLFEDFKKYKGVNASSNTDYYIMVYGVEGGYRLNVHSKAQGKPDSVILESIDGSSGRGIDIRYSAVEEFTQANLSHPTMGEKGANDEPALSTSSDSPSPAVSANGTYYGLLDVGVWETLIISGYSNQSFHFSFEESTISGKAEFSNDGYAYYYDSTGQAINFKFENNEIHVNAGYHYASLAASYTRTTEASNQDSDIQAESSYYDGYDKQEG